jgi:cobaltochelatase CobN
MHKIAATPGGWNPQDEGVIVIEQNPAPLVFLTSADTEIQTLAYAIEQLPKNFPDIRVTNLLNLQQQLTIDNYGENVLAKAQIIILRLLGGSAYWSYGLERIKEIAEAKNTALFVLPGDDSPDPDLISHSTVKLSIVNNLWRYLTEGGVINYQNALQFMSDRFLQTNYHPAPFQVISKLGIYSYYESENPSVKLQLFRKNTVAILFYRSHYLAGNILPIDALCKALLSKNLNALPIFISSLKDVENQSQLIEILQENTVNLLLNTTSFSLAKIGEESAIQLWKKLDLPVLQVILGSSTREQWDNSLMGLTPRDVAMNVALPEVDGRIITRAISFKAIQQKQVKLETDVVIYQPQSDRINFVTDLAANWVKLQNTLNADKKVALILANYPNKDGRIANGVGLDTPASCIEILKALVQAGYSVTAIPETGDDLIKLLTKGITNDLENQHLRQIYQTLSITEYQEYFATLPNEVQRGIIKRWGSKNEERGTRNEKKVGKWEIGSQKLPKNSSSFIIHNSSFKIPGIQLGNVFIGIQPSRGYDRDPSLNYHAPDLEPTHDYLAYYYWLRAKFQAHAIIHVGKHGNLEWLPGKSLALSNTCYPEVALQTIPHIYPFIVNDPGEGSQAKRRSHAIIIDHLTPPLTRAELYGGLDKLETLIDEYYEAQTLDPTRLPIISKRIEKLVKQENLDRELGITTESITQFLTIVDGYLCELKEAQIRDGLHILGQCPQGTQLRDLILAISRFSSIQQPGLTEAIAKDLGWEDWETIKERGRGLQACRVSRQDSPSTRNEEKLSTLPISEKTFASLCLCTRKNKPKDITEILETIAAELIENLIHNSSFIIHHLPLPATNKKLTWIKTHLLPSLQKTDQEITNLLHALEGKYVPSGASGAPTRGRPEVLPTGRNFYSVDIRAIPTETAWLVGSAAAEALIERYTQENGEYPQTLAISIWGTSTMRTGGDDIAQVMALMGVRPIWDGSSRRVVDFEILDSAVLNRPRVDVTVRVSGFFRDSFPNLLDLLNKITQAIAELPEPKAINPLASNVTQETQYWQNQGLTPEQAQTRANYRIFGSKPGAYGAGLQGLIEAQNWQTEADLARAYINWSSYAYDAQGKGHSTPEAFQQRLQNLQIVLQNQDNREHDLLDSDDYYQFQGGLTAAIKSVTGKKPEVYFGDNSLPNHPKVRKLTEEIAKVYRSRVINPKWIKGVMRHGYKGAFEMAATVDYLFAYDATTNCVSDYMYRGVAEAYILDESVQHFIKEKNPWALRDMAERLLEANQREMWPEVSDEMLDKLKAIVNEAEGEIENLNY